MSTPLNANLTGTFTVPGTAVGFNLALPSGYDEIELINLSSIGSTSAATPVMKAYGCSFMQPGSAYYSTKTTSASTLDLEKTTLTGGFTFIPDTGVTFVGPNLAGITGITDANPAAVSTGATGTLTGGNTVRVFNPTGMLQIGGMDFTIDTVVTNTSFNLTYLDSSGFAAPASAGSVSQVNTNSRFYPQWRYITGITQATSAQVQLSVPSGYFVGQLVRVICPDSFGMTQINGLLGSITAIDVTNTLLTLNINSSAFTAFAFPTSAVAGSGSSFAIVVPVGETATGSVANNLSDATLNTSFVGVYIDTTIQTAGEQYQWIAKNGITLPNLINP
jgi:hypothetical protein